MDVRGPHVHRVCGACHARGHGLDHLPGRDVPRHRHLRSGQNVLASGQFAVVLGPSETRFSGDDRQRRPAGEAPGLPFAACDVRVVRALGRLSAGQDFAGGLAASDGTRPPQRGAFAAARHPMRPRRHARHVPGIVRTSPVAVDVLASRRGRTDEQCGRAVVASCGDLAKAFLWDPKRQRQPLRRDDADGGGNLPPAAPQRLRLSDSRGRSSSRPPTSPFIAPRGVNGYGHC